MLIDSLKNEAIQPEYGRFQYLKGENGRRLESIIFGDKFETNLIEYEVLLNELFKWDVRYLQD